MSASAETNTTLPAKSPVAGFLDRFLQERNIRWMLGVGMIIVLASSLMLVTSHWDDQRYTPFWKYATLVGYWGLLFICGQWSYLRLGLRTTGTVLMSLAVLLVPVSFLALRWLLWAAPDEVWNHAAGTLLLGLNFALSATVARRVLGHFLRGPQPTFVASFLMLSLAGAILPAVNWTEWPRVAGFVSLALWGAFAAGAIKVNRRVFWLSEERRAPRIFGFFPILLLGGQFLVLFGAYLAPHVTPEWWGLGCVLIAVPVLLTADTLARIFQQRSGEWARPLPWSIGLPLGVGLLLCVAGVALAGAGLRPPHTVPLALVPTAALAAGLMGVLAHRTDRRVLVWAMLLLAALAYNFSYVGFKELASLAVAQAAVAVQEQRLPIAFYGLTYLPLIFALSAAGALTVRLRLSLWQGPLQTFAVSLCGLLLLLSVTHPKAMLPVGLAMAGVFAFQAIAFRQRALIAAASIAWLTACAGAPSFASLMFGFEFPTGSWLAALALGAWLLFWPGSFLDRFATRLPTHTNSQRKRGSDGNSPSLTLRVSVSSDHYTGEGARLGQAQEHLCLSIGLVATILGVSAWLALYGFAIGGEQAWPAAGLHGALLVAQAMHWRRWELGALAYAFTAAVGASFAIVSNLAIPQILSSVVLVLAGQWVALYALRASRLQRSRLLGRLHDTFGAVLTATSLAGLSAALCGVALPAIATQLLFQLPLPLGIDLSRPILLVVCLWSFDAARRRRWPALSAVGCTTLLGLAGWGLLEYAPGFRQAYLPATWAALAVVALPLVERLGHRLARTSEATGASVVKPVEIVLQLVLILVASATLAFFTNELRLAGGVAAVELLWLGARRKDATIRDTALAFLTGQVLAAVVQFICPGAKSILQIAPGDVPTLSLPLAAVAGAGLLAWRCERNGLPDSREVRLWVRGTLRALMSVMLFASLFQSRLDGNGIVLSGLAFACLIAAELGSACRRQSTARAWIAEAVAALAVAWFAWWGVVKFGHGWSMFVVLGLSLLCWLSSQFAASRPRTAVLAEPLRLTGLALPLATVAIGLWRHIHYPHPHWLGMNSLAILLAAGFYFSQAIERGERRYWPLSAAIVNIAVMLLWRELGLTDPQFYMIPIGATVIGLVQLLKREIPAVLHDPLRYLGALTILVSPTFHIVGGSWLHLLTLMTAAVLIVLVSMGLQVRALMYTGVAFLLADLSAMLVRGSVDHPNLLWIAGLALGGAVVALAAVCEHNRERVLQRLRILSAALESWD